LRGSVWLYARQPRLRLTGVMEIKGLKKGLYRGDFSGFSITLSWSLGKTLRGFNRR